MRVQRLPVVQQVADQVRDAIVGLRFRPGQRLTERDLVDLTGVSRPTLREALRQLSAEGLITASPGRGWVVTDLTREEAEDLYAVRALIEGAAGRRFVTRANDSQLKELLAAFNEVERVFSDPSADLADMMKVKNRFYDTLFAGANSTVLVSILSGLHARVSVLRARSLSRPGRPAESAREIKVIVDAIEAHDADAAAAACTKHIENAAYYALTSIGTDKTGS